MSYGDLAGIAEVPRLGREVERQIEIEAAYDGYVQRQLDEVERMSGLEEAVIPAGIEYGEVEGLSAEVKEKLLRIRPRTLGQASRVSGVTPAALSALAIFLRKRKRA
jgi:tRNA uridine 5-carboxymethylaminomethyl modification enzyme